MNKLRQIIETIVDRKLNKRRLNEHSGRWYSFNSDSSIPEDVINHISSTIESAYGMDHSAFGIGYSTPVLKGDIYVSETDTPDTYLITAKYSPRYVKMTDVYSDWVWITGRIRNYLINDLKKNRYTIQFTMRDKSAKQTSVTADHLSNLNEIEKINYIIKRYVSGETFNGGTKIITQHKFGTTTKLNDFITDIEKYTDLNVWKLSMDEIRNYTRHGSDPCVVLTEMSRYEWENQYNKSNNGPRISSIRGNGVNQPDFNIPKS